MERRVMLRMDISTLRLAELRSLLMTARVRGRDALAEQIQAEIASRGRSRPAKPAPLAFEADEVLPIDPEPPEFEASEFEAPPPEAHPPLAFETDDVSPIDFGSAPDDFVFRPSKADRPPARRWPIGLAVAGVLTVGAAATWGLNGAPALLRSPPAPPVALAASPSPAPRAMTVRTAAPQPTPQADAPEPTPTVEAKAEPARDRPSRLDPCATPPSPADRLLCNDLALNLLDHEMRDAYRHAVEGARDPVADARTLAGLYDRRIRELNAAALPPPP